MKLLIFSLLFPLFATAQTPAPQPLVDCFNMTIEEMEAKVSSMNLGKPGLLQAADECRVQAAEVEKHAEQEKQLNHHWNSFYLYSMASLMWQKASELTKDGTR